MTSVTSVNNAALLILQQANASSTSNNTDQVTATDKLTAIVNGVSSEDSAVRTQASSKINSGLLDAQQANDSIVSHALDFLESDSFKSSDPRVTATLKKLISEDGDKFAVLVKAEKAKHSGISDDNAIANAIQGLIRSNRDKFMDDEFVIGFKLSGGGAIIANIADIDGNSVTKSLDEERSAATEYRSDTIEDFFAHLNDPSGSSAFDGSRLNSSMTSLLSVAQERSEWTMNWYEAFGF